uniref:Uncharacterized protein n=1 Tax=Manihot esculenta TaxID=3983 RepID=A0A2C9W7X4_MANES
MCPLVPPLFFPCLTIAALPYLILQQYSWANYSSLRI